MKTNVQIKDEPIDCQVEKFIRLYSYSTTMKSSETKTSSNQDLEPSTCAWCQKLGSRTFSIRTDSDETKSLCSEICFNHYRRASFKKNKGSDINIEQKLLPIVKLKSPEKKKREQQIIETNRRKILIPHRQPTPTNSKISRITSPVTSKRHRSSSPPPTDHLSINPNNLPVSLTWQPSLFPWSCPIDINRFQYPFLPPPPPPPQPMMSLPPPAPISASLPTRSSSDLFTTLSKGIISNVTCILPTFLPLPIPIPIPIPIPSGYSKKTSHQQTQTDSPKRLRRTSI